MEDFDLIIMVLIFKLYDSPLPVNFIIPNSTPAELLAINAAITAG